MLLWPDAVKRFYADTRTTIRPGTRTTWSFPFRQLQAVHPGKVLTEFTPDDLVAFLNQTHDQQARRWAPGTVRSYRAALSSLFGWAFWNDHISADPAARLHRRVRIRNDRVGHVHWLDHRQIAALISTTDTGGPVDDRDRVVLLLGLLAGLRTSEQTSLDWKDVDLRYRRMRVRRKGNRPATLGIAPALAVALTGWQDVSMSHLATGRADAPVLAPLHPSREPVLGSRLDGEALRRIVRRRGVQAGIHGLRPHDLRRTFAALLDSQAVPLVEISAILGHASVATTQTYLAANPAAALARLVHLQV